MHWLRACRLCGDRELEDQGRQRDPLRRGRRRKGRRAPASRVYLQPSSARMPAFPVARCLHVCVVCRVRGGLCSEFEGESKGQFLLAVADEESEEFVPVFAFAFTNRTAGYLAFASSQGVHTLTLGRHVVRMQALRVAGRVEGRAARGDWRVPARRHVAQHLPPHPLAHRRHRRRPGGTQLFAIPLDARLNTYVRRCRVCRVSCRW